jgi:hypothetical protein
MSVLAHGFLGFLKTGTLLHFLWLSFVSILEFPTQIYRYLPRVCQPLLISRDIREISTAHWRSPVCPLKRTDRQEVRKWEVPGASRNDPYLLSSLTELFCPWSFPLNILGGKISCKNSIYMLKEN